MPNLGFLFLVYPHNHTNNVEIEKHSDIVCGGDIRVSFNTNNRKGDEIRFENRSHEMHNGGHQNQCNDRRQV